ncbi:MAG: disulfide oxidoreductase [Candidatus Glassbacteria bacterium]|nr:disulfide oxidoreductase [Candidatus Glassbacteria bacterium]
MAKKFSQEMTLKEVAAVGPKAARVIEKHFGKDCFRCPSFSVEPLFMGARMHALDVELILRELNSTVG